VPVTSRACTGCSGWCGSACPKGVRRNASRMGREEEVEKEREGAGGTFDTPRWLVSMVAWGSSVPRE
jgi:ferredoxin